MDQRVRTLLDTLTYRVFRVSAGLDAEVTLQTLTALPDAVTSTKDREKLS